MQIKVKLKNNLPLSGSVESKQSLVLFPPTSSESGCLLRQTQRILLVLVISGLCLWTLIATAAETAVTPEQLQQLNARIQALQGQIQNTRTEYGQLQAQLQQNEEDIGKTTERLETLAEDLSTKQHNLTELQTQQRIHAKQLAEQRRRLAKQIRSAYIVGRQDYLKLWLNQQDPFTIGRVLTYYDYFNRLRTRQITAIQATLQRIATLKQRIQQESTELTQLSATQTTKKQALELSYRERQKILAQLATTLDTQDKTLKQLQEDKQHLEKLLGVLQDNSLQQTQETQSHQPFVNLKGQLDYPVKGTVINQFGDLSVGRLKWQGLLIAAELGEKVRAIAAGRIIFAEWFRQLGLLVIIDHGNGYMSLYAHNQHLHTKAGHWVNRGDTIASVGNSGGHNTTALYFEIRHQGVPINPAIWLHN